MEMDRPESDATKPAENNSAEGFRVELNANTSGLPRSEAVSAAAAAVLPDITLNDDIQKGAAVPGSHSVVVVDKSAHRTHVLQMNGNSVVEVLNVPDAVGKNPNWTPEGKFHVIERTKNPSYCPTDGSGCMGPGPNNPLGPAKLRTDAGGGLILLHGTNRPDSIGTNASHGCIRHQNADILKIFPLVKMGDSVYITKHFKGTTIDREDFSP
jgi:lipoprotein-anchoring transpeptidase ErfK/SrfK